MTVVGGILEGLFAVVVIWLGVRLLSLRWPLCDCGTRQCTPRPEDTEGWCDCTRQCPKHRRPRAKLPKARRL